GPAVGEVGRGRSLKQVAAIDEKNLAARRAFVARALDRGGNVRRATTSYAVRIRSRFQRSVKVVGRDDPEEPGAAREPRARRSDRSGYNGIHRARDLCAVSASQRPVLREVIRLAQCAAGANLVD